MSSSDYDLASLLQLAAGRIHATAIEEVLLSPWFHASVLVVLLCERIAPVHRDQAPFARGVRQDLVWAAYGVTLEVLVVGAYVVVLRQLYRSHLSFLTIQAAAAWPWMARVVFALLFADLVKWFTHVARHKVPLLWRFHAVHHSQRELNFFSDFRIHPLDALGDHLVRFVPIFMVDPSFATIAAVEWARQWHARLYHANVRTNFGWLRYVLVTPQSHRVHHSVEPRHQDRNFGATFSVWDHLFRTQYRDYGEYPRTGIRDATFPVEQDACRAQPLGCFLRQLVHPFRPTRRYEAAQARSA